MLHAMFKAAVRDRIIDYNPCDGSNLPKVIAAGRETITPRAVREAPVSHPRPAPAAAAGRDRDRDALGGTRRAPPPTPGPERGLIVVAETIVEISKKDSPTGQRYTVKPYPKNDKPRTLKIAPELAGLLERAHRDPGMGPRTCCSPPHTATCSSRPPATPSAPGSGDPPSKPPGCPHDADA